MKVGFADIYMTVLFAITFAAFGMYLGMGVAESSKLEDVVKSEVQRQIAAVQMQHHCDHAPAPAQ
jgi:hypothetical protein